MVKLIVFRLYPCITISFILYAPMLRIQLFLKFLTKQVGGEQNSPRFILPYHENLAAYLIFNGILYK